MSPHNEWDTITSEDVFLYLRPMEDMNNTITHYGNKINLSTTFYNNIPFSRFYDEWLRNEKRVYFWLNHVPCGALKILAQYHFDYMNLIGQGMVVKLDRNEKNIKL